MPATGEMVEFDASRIVEVRCGDVGGTDVIIDVTGSYRTTPWVERPMASCEPVLDAYNRSGERNP